MFNTDSVKAKFPEYDNHKHIFLAEAMQELILHQLSSRQWRKYSQYKKRLEEGEKAMN